MNISIRNIDYKVYKKFKEIAKKKGYILGVLLSQLMANFNNENK